jgi:acyl-CoA thioesterase FadM
MSQPTETSTNVLPTLYSGVFYVPFFWADPAGILFFGNIHFAAHQTWENWSRDETGLWELWFGSTKDLVYPLRTTTADFFRPMKYGIEFKAEIKLESVSDSTFVLLTEFSYDGVLHARVRSVHTAVSVRSMQKTSLPAAWRSYFKPGKAL